MLAAERERPPTRCPPIAATSKARRTLLGTLDEADKAAVSSLGHVGRPWLQPRSRAKARPCASSTASWWTRACARTTLRQPCRGLPARRPLPKILSHDEVERLFAQAEQDAESGRYEAVRLLTLARIALRVRPACDRVGLAAARRGAARCAVPDRHRQGRSGADGAGFEPGETGARQDGWNCATARANILFPSRGKHLTRIRLFQLLKELAARAGLRSGETFAARAAPCLRNPSARRRGRLARAADPARPCRHRDHPDLHPCRCGAAGRSWSMNAILLPASAKAVSGIR